jgi:hypothetical protein
VGAEESMRPFSAVELDERPQPVMAQIASAIAHRKRVVVPACEKATPFIKNPVLRHWRVEAASNDDRTAAQRKVAYEECKGRSQGNGCRARLTPE